MREVAERFDVDVAILHLGEVQFPITGPIRYGMTANDGIELCRLIEPRTAIPVHYEGWSHFHEGRAAVERAISEASEDVRRRFRLMTLGKPVDISR